jgi:hypothetical protein
VGWPVQERSHARAACERGLLHGCTEAVGAVQAWRLLLHRARRRLAQQLHVAHAAADTARGLRLLLPGARVLLANGWLHVCGSHSWWWRGWQWAQHTGAMARLGAAVQQWILVLEVANASRAMERCVCGRKPCSWAMSST